MQSRLWMFLAFFGASFGAVVVAHPLWPGDCVGLEFEHKCCTEHNLPTELCMEGGPCVADILLDMNVRKLSYNQNSGWTSSTQFPEPNVYCIFTIKTCDGVGGCDPVRNDEWGCKTKWEPLGGQNCP